MSGTALATVAVRRVEELDALYDAAVAYGANDTRASREVEAAHHAIEMLAFALNRIPDIAIFAYGIEIHPVRRSDVLSTEATGMSQRVAGALRLLHRAATIDARTTGYCPRAWREEALRHAATVLDLAADDPHFGPSAIGETRLATLSLTRAIVATSRDRLGVPGHIAEALGSLLALYALADSLAR